MSADGSLFIYPPGKSPEQLFQTLKVLIDRLNQIKAKDNTDLTAINEAIEDAQEAVGDIQEFLEGTERFTEQKAFELSLVTAVDTMLGSVSNAVLESIKQSQMAAEATIRSLLEGKRNSIAIRVEQTARLTDREAFANQIETIEARLGTAEASIVTETTARTNADNALSSVDQTLSTALNGNIAQVSILAASVDGIEGKFGVAVNANGQVVGLVQLDGSAAGSTFTVVADKFLVAQPDATGGAPVPVLAVGNVGGTPKLVWRGDMYGDGSITVQKLNVSQLSAISANLGTVTAGLIRNADDTIRFDLPNMRLYRTDGRFDLDIKNLRWRMGSGA